MLAVIGGPLEGFEIQGDGGKLPQSVLAHAAHYDDKVRDAVVVVALAMVHGRMKV
jgi:hypothetical protein